MSNFGLAGGSVIGAAFAVSDNPATIEHTIFQMLASAGICGLIMWVLLRAQMARAERDETRRDISERALVEMTGRQIEIQVRTANLLDKISEQMADRNLVQSAQRNDLHELIVRLAFRPCLLKEEEIGKLLKKTNPEL